MSKKPSRPSYTELGLISLLEHMQSRIERLEDMVNEHGFTKKDDDLPPGFEAWWGEFAGYSRAAKFIGDESVHRDTALEIWEAALNSKNK